MEQQSKQNSQDKKEDDKPNTQAPKPLPNQYNRANVSYKEDASDSDSTFDEHEFMGMVAAFNDANCRMQQGIAQMIDIKDEDNQGTEAISVSIEERHANVQWAFQDDSYIVISDNGANSCLLSTKSFYIESVVQHRFATIKGCKSTSSAEAIELAQDLLWSLPMILTTPISVSGSMRAPYTMKT